MLQLRLQQLACGALCSSVCRCPILCCRNVKQLHGQEHVKQCIMHALVHGCATHLCSSFVLTHKVVWHEPEIWAKPEPMFAAV